MIAPTFKIRCSQIGEIMGGVNKPTEKQLALLNDLQARADGNGRPLTDKQCTTLAELIEKRDSKPKLLDGAKTYLQGWMKEQLYKRTREFSTKFTEKGKLCEPQAIEMVAKKMGYGMVDKNETRIENDFMQGECDLLLPEIIEEIKNSWSPFTFPLFETEPPEKDYIYQIHGYMGLYGKKRGAINYCLIDAPEEIIMQEAMRVSRKAGYEEIEMELYDEVKQKMTFSDVPDSLRIKRFEIELDETIIQAIKERVELCREYINQEWAKLEATVLLTQIENK